jgi:hypothetical protein
MMARPGMRFRWKLTVSLTLALTVLSFWLLIRGRPIGFPQRDKSKSNRPNEISDSAMSISNPATHANAAANQSSSKEPRSNRWQRRAPVCANIFAKIVSQNDNPSLSLATLSLEGERPSLVRLGSTLGKSQVVGIGYDRGRMSPSVFISNEHGLCQAMLFESPETAVTPSKSTAHKKTTRGQTQSTEIRVDRSAVNSIFERAFELTRDTRIVPEVKDGSTIGIRVFGVHPDSLLAALGLENGDRIERVNGAPISTMEAALSVYTKLQSAERVAVDLNRAGRPFRIDIRVD